MTSMHLNLDYWHAGSVPEIDGEPEEKKGLEHGRRMMKEGAALPAGYQNDKQANRYCHFERRPAAR
jgi:hypothetical protein